MGVCPALPSGREKSKAIGHTSYGWGIVGRMRCSGLAQSPGIPGSLGALELPQHSQGTVWTRGAGAKTHKGAERLGELGEAQ